MAKLRHRADGRNLQPDLFAWAAEQNRRHRYSLAARIIARRYHLTGSRAALLCEIAGIGGAE